MNTFEDYYETLQVSPSAESEVIEAAYRKLAYKYHPDRNSSPSSAETMRKINVAHDILCDPSRRQLYNQEWLQRSGHKANDIPKHEANNAPKYKAEYVPRDEANNAPKYKAEYVPRDEANNAPKSTNETIVSGRLNIRRIVIIIFLVADVTLASVFILTPLIGLFIIQNTWIFYVLSTILGALVASLIFAAKFRELLFTQLKSTFKLTQKWISSESANNNFLDRFLVFVLIFILIALLVYIYVIPWVIQIFTTGPLSNAILLVTILLFIAFLLPSRRFRLYCLNTIQSIWATIQRFIPNNFNADESDPNIGGWTWAPRNMNDRFSTSVWNAIFNFRPSRQYDYERGYHDELFNYLKSKFHQAKSNVRKGASQPDIHIGNIAIEVKGPTGKRELVTLTDKSGRYLAMGHHTVLFIVLFQPMNEITPAYFEELKRSLLSRYPDVGVITKRNS